MAYESKDYPFMQWNTYFTAFAEGMCSGGFGVDFAPKYTKLTEQKGFNADLEIMEELLNNGNDPQEGLRGLVQACMDGARYAQEIISDLEDIFKKMVKKGASIDQRVLEMIMTPLYSDHANFEDEMGNLIVVKGLLLKLFLEKFDGVTRLFEKMVPDWEQIEPAYYEDMLTQDDTDDSCAFPLDAQYHYIDAYYKALKYAMEGEEREDEEDKEEDYIAFVKSFDAMIPMSKEDYAKISEAITTKATHGRFLEKCVNMDILRYAWTHWKDSGWIWANPHIADNILESIDYFDECVNHNNESQLMTDRKAFGLRCLNSNPNDNVVDWLLANPRYIRMKSLFYNSNKKAVMHCLSYLSSPEYSPEHENYRIHDFLLMYSHPYEESIEFGWNHVKSYLDNMTDSIRTETLRMMANLDRPVTCEYVEQLFLRDYDENKSNDASSFPRIPREIFRSQHPQIIDIILKFVNNFERGYNYDEETLLVNPNDRIVDFLLKNIVNKTNNNRMSRLFARNPNDRVVDYLINEIEKGRLDKKELWRNPNKRAIEYSLNAMIDSQLKFDEVFTYEMVPEVLKYVLTLFSNNKNNKNNDTDCNLIFFLLQKYSMFSDITIDIYDPTEEE